MRTLGPCSRGPRPSPVITTLLPPTIIEMFSASRPEYLAEGLQIRFGGWLELLFFLASKKNETDCRVHDKQSYFIEFMVSTFPHSCHTNLRVSKRYADTKSANTLQLGHP
jgi:hypothetical protein